jgi:hypothetical protein
VLVGRSGTCGSGLARECSGLRSGGLYHRWHDFVFPDQAGEIERLTLDLAFGDRIDPSQALEC